MSGWTILAGAAVAVTSCLVFLTIAATALERVELDLRAWEKRKQRAHRCQTEKDEIQVETVSRPAQS